MSGGGEGRGSVYQLVAVCACLRPKAYACSLGTGEGVWLIPRKWRLREHHRERVLESKKGME